MKVMPLIRQTIPAREQKNQRLFDLHRTFSQGFHFQNSSRERENLKCQIGTSSSGHGGRRRPPYAFTEHGAIMAANVLNSPRAVLSARTARLRKLSSLARPDREASLVEHRAWRPNPDR